jgi:hypothetical protein
MTWGSENGQSIFETAQDSFMRQCCGGQAARPLSQGKSAAVSGRGGGTTDPANQNGGKRIWDAI